MDLTMSEIQNSREREVDDWAKLFEMAGPGFEFQEAELPKGANLWILVAEWKGNWFDGLQWHRCTEGLGYDSCRRATESNQKLSALDSI